ncbi:Mur ligase [Phycomyces nitens]|nr:Mur ligase [Phycomyces nitens]
MDLGLERIKALLTALGNPQDRLKAVHVAGTNGKGSICAYISSVLHQHNITVGRFNSPHLLEPRDSIRVNEELITQEVYVNACKHIQAVDTKAGTRATSFECQVATALWLFDQLKLDVVVIEVGMGGKLDATNVFEVPLVSVLTPIGWDHAGMLGGSIESITEAKAGIIKPNCPVVISPQEDPSILKVIISYAQELGAPCVCVQSAECISQTNHGMLCHLEYVAQNTLTHESWNIKHEYPIPLNGDYQRSNSATAVTVLDWLSRLDTLPNFTLDPDLLKLGMERTSWPGRLDWITPETHPKLKRPDWDLLSVLVDGAHNPPATSALRIHVDSLCSKYHLSRVIWILGATMGKDVKAMVKSLVQPNDIVYSVPFSQPTGMPWINSVDPIEISDCAKDIAAESEGFKSLDNALLKASSVVRHGRDLVVLCGSLYLVADFYRLLD